MLGSARKRPLGPTLVAALALAGLLAACGSSNGGTNDAKASSGVTTSGSAGDATLLASGVAIGEATMGGVAGCADAVGDPDDDSAGRMPSRCDVGAPAPVPLPEKTKLKVAINFKVGGYSPLLMAERMGEFDKENLDVEIVQIPTVDALPLLATGDLDVAAAAPEASLFSGVSAGLEVKIILGANFSPSAGDFSIDQQGIWARADAFSDPANPDLAELKGQTMGSAVGFTSAIMWPMESALNEAGTSLNDMRVETVPSSATVQALENGAIQAAWVLDPYWQDLVGNDDFVLVATAAPGAQLGAYAAGPNLLVKDREAGVAFARAMIRTINTYYHDGYPTDPAILAELAAALEQPVESVKAIPPTYMDWEMRSWGVSGAQQTFLDLDQLPYEELIPNDQLLDNGLYLDAVGAK